jgi:EAL domain-containing protein (putative c-di-GMP-specific phosphodiesterase class I)
MTDAGSRPSSQVPALSKLEVMAGPLAIVDSRQISIVYQPIVSLDSGEIFAYEALTRCSDERFHTIPELFDAAADAGYAGTLGRTVRELAVGRAPRLPLFINIHPQELEESWLVRPDDPLCSHADGVFLEITESAPLLHPALCIDVLNELRKRAGAQIVVDDFGAGYSNLSRISELCPEIVKLDRSLIHGIDVRSRSSRLVTSLVRLCEDLGSRVVAEGIETRAEYRAVIESGVQFGQGFWLARPSFPPPTDLNCQVDDFS